MRIKNIETGNEFDVTIDTPYELESVQQQIDSNEFQIIQISKQEEQKIKFPKLVLHVCLEDRLLAQINKNKKDREKAGATA